MRRSPASTSGRRAGRAGPVRGQREVVGRPGSARACGRGRAGRGGRAARRRSAGSRARPSPASTRTSRAISSNESTSSRGSQTSPSAGMQYLQRKLHLSVTDTRRLLISRPQESRSGSTAAKASRGFCSPPLTTPRGRERWGGWGGGSRVKGGWGGSPAARAGELAPVRFLERGRPAGSLAVHYWRLTGPGRAVTSDRPRKERT